MMIVSFVVIVDAIRRSYCCWVASLPCTNDTMGRKGNVDMSLQFVTLICSWRRIRCCKSQKYNLLSSRWTRRLLCRFLHHRHLSPSSMLCWCQQSFTLQNIVLLHIGSSWWYFSTSHKTEKWFSVCLSHCGQKSEIKSRTFFSEETINITIHITASHHPYQ